MHTLEDAWTMALSTIDLPERLHVLFHQESTTYRTGYYLREIPTSVVSLGGSRVSPSYDGMDPTWRERMVEWAYGITDYCNFPREIVAFCMNLADRYVAVYNASEPCGISKNLYRLLVLSCLVVAIKLNRPIQGTLPMGLVLYLCQNRFTRDHLIWMEKDLFDKLSWQLHPPTAFCFMRHFLLHLPNVDQDAVVNLARYWIELSVTDYFFVAYQPSAIAVAALLNAVRHLAAGLCASAVVAQLEALVPLEDLDNVHICQGRLWHLHTPADSGHFNDGQNVLAESPAAQAKDSRTISPVSVTDFS